MSEQTPKADAWTLAEQRIVELEAEIKALKHDIKRHVQIAADLANENAALGEE